MNELGKRVLPGLLLLAVGISAAPAMVGQGYAQNFSGLNGKELQSKSDTEGDLGVLLGGLLNKGSKIPGSITNVQVKRDSERQLVLSVSSTQLDNKILWGEVRDRDGKPQLQILTTSVVVPAGANPAELTFALDERLPKDTKLESMSLHLFAANTANSAPGLVRAYSLGKQWQMDIRPENMVTLVTPQPIEEAAALTERPLLTIMPAKILTPQSMRKAGAVAMPKLMLPDQQLRIRPQ